MNTRNASQAANTQPREIKIGLWGGTSTGKTTYLSALQMATTLHPEGGWNITGMELDYPGSGLFLASNTRMLRRGNFPKGTDSPSEYKFDINGRVSPGLLAGVPEYLRKMAGVERQVSFSLYVRDYPGGHFSDVVDINDPMWTNLAQCDGLIYLYDVGSKDDSLDYVNLACNFLKNLTKKERLAENKLPHFLAICISKFDAPEVFKPLREHGLVQQNQNDERQTPYVTDTLKAIKELKIDRMTMEILESTFHPKRTQYFFSSSIGFFAEPESPINLDDCENVINVAGVDKIRSGRNTYPVNVFPPLMWIEDQVNKLARKSPAAK